MTGKDLPTVAAVAGTLERSPAASFLVSNQGLIVAANTATAVLAGATEPLDGLSPHVFDLSPAMARHGEHLLEQVMSGQLLTLAWRTRFRRLDGHVNEPVVVSETAVDLADGHYVLFTVTVAPESGTALGLSQTEDDIVGLVTDHEWRVTYMTSAAKTIIKVDGGDEPALFGLVHPLDMSHLATGLTLLVESGVTVSSPLTLQCGDEWRTFAAHLSALCVHAPPRLLCLLSAPSSGPLTQVARVPKAAESAVLSLAAEKTAGGAEFTGRQLEIIDRSLRGQSSADIAREMFLSRGTVRNALVAIYRKFGVHTQSAMVAALLTGSRN